MMSKEEILEKHADMFKNLEEYALVKKTNGDRSWYIIMHKTNMGFVLIEENSEEVESVMIELGVQIADNEEEIRPADFKAYTVIWNEEKQDWDKILQEDFIRMLDERNNDRR